MPEKDPHPGPDDLDPGASTQMFQAFVERRESEEESAAPRTRPVLVVGGLLALVIVLVLAWLVFA